MKLKKVKYFEAGSQETPCFTADLWDNGKLVAHLENNGHGGSNMVHPAKGLTNKDVAKYCDLDTECEIFGMVYEEADIRKYQSKGFYLKRGDKYFTQKFPMPISKLKKHIGYPNWIIAKKKSIENDGYTILNRNL